MDEASISKYIRETLADVETAENFGYTFFFYSCDHKLPFATLASSDNDYDRASSLDRPGVFRLNLGVSKQTFQSLFRPEGFGHQSLRFYPVGYDHASSGLCGAAFHLRAYSHRSHVRDVTANGRRSIRPRQVPSCQVQEQMTATPNHA